VIVSEEQPYCKEFNFLKASMGSKMCGQELIKMSSLGGKSMLMEEEEEE
jgi:hypothetical protein